MTDIAICVDNPCPEPGRRISKLYHLGALQQRPDTTSTVLSASLRDALTSFLPRGPRIMRITRIKDRDNPSNPSNPWQVSGSADLWALCDVLFAPGATDYADYTDQGSG